MLDVVYIIEEFACYFN